MMRKIKILSTLAMSILALSIVMISCQPEEIIDPTDKGVNVRDGGALLQGIYDEDITLTSDVTYLLSGGVHFEAGATLTIEAGTVIESDPSITAAPFCYLMIEQDATIDAQGTPSAPIIFTSGAATKTPGDWGGLIVNGKAPVNKGVNVDSEIAGYPYGGTDPGDNSGIIKYVIVEYGGAKIDPDTEHNGFTFNGVGTGTVVENIMAYFGTDDGIEMFGGSVNLKNVISWANTDDGFDWTYGYTGTVENLLIYTGVGGDRGIEADNNSSNHSQEHFSNPTIKNLTIIGSGTQNEDSKDPQGIELRRGTKAQIYNALVVNFKESLRISDEVTNEHIQSGDIEVDYSMFKTGITYKFPEKITDDDKLFEASADMATWADLDLSTSNFAVVYPGGKDGGTIGACDPSDNWWTGWTRAFVGTTTEIPNYETLADGAILEGNYAKNIRLAEDNTYTLKGGVHIQPGFKIIIEPGVTVKHDPAISAAPYCYLMVEKGATIEAEGTVDKPIVFTSGATTPSPGDWGGIIVNGSATVNKGVDVDSEIAGYPYGGTSDDDNSGIIKYVRVEYGGAKIDPDTEHNGFTFNGVGSGTTVEYIEAWNGTDDGIEMFGGTVNLKYVVSWNNTDDGFDWTYGWKGKVQHLLIKTGDIGDRGIEGDNNSSNNTATPFSEPILSNVTIISSGTQNEDNNDPQGIEMRRGTKGKYYNFIITNFLGSSVRVSDNQSHLNVEDGSLDLDYSYMDGTPEYKESGVIASGNEFEASANVFTSQTITLSGTNGFVGTFTGGYDMNADDDWFDSTDYIGAVKSDAIWLDDWTVF
ncbi:MAG: hypothetical protein ACQERS_02595 [Bacteroidota bacterium]